MAAGSVRIAVKTTADNSGFTESAAAAEQFGQRLTQISALATGGLALLGGAAVKMAADFQHSMDQVGAVAGATEQEMAGLAETAKRIGAESAYSASQAAGAMEELAANGVTAADMMNGAADAAVNLAAAGGTTLPNAARIASTAMAAWKMDASQMTDVVNRLAGAANTSRFGVEDMGQAIAAAGGVAATYGVEFKEMAAAVTATASSFSSGADAGTSFKTFLNSLSGNSKEAQATIEDLGLQFFDAQNKLKPLSEVVGELNTKLAGLDERARTDALKTIFGSDAFRTAAGLMEMTAAEFENLMTTMGNTDAAAIAEQRMSNMKGSVDELMGSLETLGIALGEKALPALSEAAGMATDAVNAFSGLPGSTQALALGFSAIAIASPAAVSGVAGIANGLKEMKSAFSGGEMSNLARVQTMLPGIATGLGAVSVAADIILKKNTGYGLMEHLFGDVNQMQAYAEATQKITDSLYGLTDPAAKNAKLIDDLTQAMGSWVAADAGVAAFNAAKSEGLWQQNAAMAEANALYRDQEEAVRATFRALIDNQASVGQLVGLYNQLPPELQKIADETANVTGKQEAYTATLANQQNEFYKNWEAANEATTGIQDFSASTVEAERTTAELSESINDLTAKFASTNPEMAAVQTSLALVREAISDYENSNRELTASEKEHLEALKGQEQALLNRRDGLKANQDAVVALGGSLTELMGEKGYEGLMAAMDGAGQSHESQIDILALVRESYGHLSAEDIPAAKESFQQLKDTLSPAEWDAIAKALGPEVLKSLGMINESPEKTAAVAEWERAGADIMAGLEGGIKGAAANVVAAAVGVVRDALTKSRAEAGAESPAKKWIPLGRDMVDGVAVGMNERSPELNRAAAEMASGAAAAAGAGMKYGLTLYGVAGSAPVGGGGSGYHRGSGPGSTGGMRPGGGESGSVEQLIVLINSLDDGARAQWWAANGWMAQAITDAGYYIYEDGTVGSPSGYHRGSGPGSTGGTRPGAGVGSGPTARPGAGSTGGTRPGGGGTGSNKPNMGDNTLYNMPRSEFERLMIQLNGMSPADRKAWWDARPGMKEYFESQGYYVNQVGQVNRSDGGGPLSNNGWSQEVNDINMGKFRENFLEGLKADIEASPNAGRLNSHRASAWSDPWLAEKYGVPYFNENGPEQWMIDAGNDQFGSPLWAKYGWNFDPHNGWSRSGGSAIRGSVGGVGLGGGMLLNQEVINAMRGEWGGEQYPLSGTYPTGGGGGGSYSSGGGGGYAGGGRGVNSYTINIYTWDSKSMQDFMPRFVEEMRSYEERFPGKRAR